MTQVVVFLLFFCVLSFFLFFLFPFCLLGNSFLLSLIDKSVTLLFFYVSYTIPSIAVARFLIWQLQLRLLVLLAISTGRRRQWCFLGATDSKTSQEGCGK